MTANATIKMPRRHYSRTMSALADTERMLCKLRDESLIAFYNKHAKRLRELLDCAEIVDGATGAEEIEMANTAYAFLQAK